MIEKLSLKLINMEVNYRMKHNMEYRYDFVFEDEQVSKHQRLNQTEEELLVSKPYVI